MTAPTQSARERDEAAHQIRFHRAQDFRHPNKMIRSLVRNEMNAIRERPVESEREYGDSDYRALLDYEVARERAAT